MSEQTNKPEDDGLTPWQRYKKNLGETRPWQLLNPNEIHSSEEEADRRLSICRSCPELISLTQQCKKCGCVMPLKVKLQKAVCPVGKW